jgi:tetratricopeptide (TPR) repeat protein
MEIRAIRAFALGDRPGLKYVTRQLLARPRQLPAATAIQVAVYQDDLSGAENFARTLLDPGEARITRGFAHRLLAQTSLARGQVGRAELELTASAAIDPDPALELQSLYVTFPLFSFPRSTIAQVLNAVEAWRTVDSPADSLHTAAHAGLHEHIRLHRLGVLRLALGDTAGARKAVAALEALRGDERSRRYARTLAWSLRARRVAAARRPNDALAMLDRADWTPAAEVFVAEVADRFLRAELLEQVGRQEDALRWYESIAQRAIYELVYLAPAELRQAVIHDRLGNRTEALRHYRRLVELWRDCDPALRPVLREAARRINELEHRR